MPRIKTGTFSQPAVITINLENLYNQISDILSENVLAYFASKNSTKVSDDDIEIEFDDDNIQLTITYTGTYRHTHYDATEIDPPDDDYTFHPDESDFSHKELTKYLKTHVPKWLQSCIQTTEIKICNDVTIHD